MARSPLFRQLARVEGAVQKALGTLVSATLHQADLEERDSVTGNPAYTPVGPIDVRIEGNAGVAVSSDKTDPGSRLVVTVFDPDVRVTEDDYFTWGTPTAGEDPDRHRVRRVLGLVQDDDGSRYVTRCEVD